MTTEERLERVERELAAGIIAAAKGEAGKRERLPISPQAI